MARRWSRENPYGDGAIGSAGSSGCGRDGLVSGGGWARRDGQRDFEASNISLSHLVVRNVGKLGVPMVVKVEFARKRGGFGPEAAIGLTRSAMAGCNPAAYCKWKEGRMGRPGLSNPPRVSTCRQLQIGGQWWARE
jgi:hypothetical protein